MKEIRMWMLAIVVILWNVIVFTSCSNEDKSVMPTIPVAQEWDIDHEYISFIEEGKVWNCGSVIPETATIELACIFTMRGDTLIGKYNYKKVFCQYEKYYGDNGQHYYCAVREEDYRVFIVEAQSIIESTVYDFSHPQETLMLSYGDNEFARTSGYREMQFPTKLLEFGLSETSGGDVDYYYGLGSWIEGVGFINGNPFACELYGSQQSFDDPIIVVSCKSNGKSLFDLEWLAQPSAVGD